MPSGCCAVSTGVRRLATDPFRTHDAIAKFLAAASVNGLSGTMSPQVTKPRRIPPLTAQSRCPRLHARGSRDFRDIAVGLQSRVGATGAQVSRPDDEKVLAAQPGYPVRPGTAPGREGAGHAVRKVAALPWHEQPEQVCGQASVKARLKRRRGQRDMCVERRVEFESLRVA